MSKLPRRVGVIGGGRMGVGIAHAFCLGGCEIVVVERDSAAATSAGERLERTLLKSAGVPVRQWRSEAAFYAGNSLSTTLPGGPVLARRGAPPRPARRRGAAHPPVAAVVDRRGGPADRLSAWWR